MLRVYSRYFLALNAEVATNARTPKLQVIIYRSMWMSRIHVHCHPPACLPGSRAVDL
jgi:hypothetical protein